MNEAAQLQSFESFYNGLSVHAAQRLIANGMRLNALRTNALLRKDEWKAIDSAVVQVAREQLTLIDDLRSANLVRNLGGLGTLIDEYEREGDMGPAEVDMSGTTPGQEDQTPFDLVGVPVPVVHKNFRINIRRLEASRKLGNTIDVTNSQVATRKVAEGLEDLGFKGAQVTVDGNKIYGLLTHPDRNTGTLSDWSTDPDKAYDDANEMISRAEGNNHNGPFNMYIPANRAKTLREVYSDGSGQSVLRRIEENLPQINSVRIAGRLPSDNVVMVQMTSDVIDLSVGEDIIPIEWNTMGGLVVHMKVMAVMVVRVKSDKKGQSGVVHFVAND